MKTYLSIDLDFWDMKHFNGKYINEGKEFLKFIFDNFEGKITVVKSHEELVPYINKLKDLKKIINIDYHSDLADEPIFELNEGVWLNFVKNRKLMNYEWRMPNKKECLIDGWGRCDSSMLSISKPKFEKMGYKKIKFTEGLTNINYNTIIQVGISNSFSWTFGKLEEFLKKEYHEKRRCY
jgi:hypothetical protein